MASIKSQIKRNHTNEKRYLKNKSTKSAIKTALKGVYNEIDTKQKTSETIDQNFQNLAFKLLDKAASKNIKHKNFAARHKSKIMQRINELKTVIT